MKRVFILSLIVLLAATGLVALIEYDPGYVLVSYGLYTVETSVWLAAGAFVMLFVLIYFMFSVVRRTLHRSQMLRQWFSGRDYRRSQRRTTEGLITFIEGNWDRSRKILAKAATKSETPLLNYLMAARASCELGDDAQIKHYLKLAEQSTSGADIAVALTQAELQLQRGRLEQSLATLMRVRLNADKHPYILKLLMSVYLGLRDWDSLFDLLPQLRKHKVASKDELEQLELQACKAKLDDSVIIKKEPLNELRKVWQSLPKAQLKDSGLVACYARHLIKLADHITAEKILAEQLKREWSLSLVDLYGKIQGADVARQLLRAENWLQERNNDATLLRCLGRLSLRNQLWGKAREYFENGLLLENSSETCAELGRLLAKLGEHEKSNEYFSRGLLVSTDGLPELPMPETSKVG